MALWVIRILFLCLSTMGGYAISQVREEFVGLQHSGLLGIMFGVGVGWVMNAIDEKVEGLLWD